MDPYDCTTLQELDRLVWTDNRWQNDGAVLNSIFSRFTQLQADGDSFPNFGTSEFWTQLMGGDEVDVDRMNNEHRDQWVNPGLGPDDNGVTNEEMLNALAAEIEGNSEDDVADEQLIALMDQLEAEGLFDNAAQAGGGEPLDFNHHCTFENIRERHSRAFRTLRTTFRVTFRNMAEVNDTTQLMEAILDLIIQRAFDGMTTPEDRVGMTINHPELDNPILIPFLPRNRLTAQQIIRHILKVMQSRKKFALDSALEITVVRIRGAVPGSARRGEKKKLRVNHNLWKDANSPATGGGRGGAFILIKNDDNLCCARALVTSKAWVDKSPHFDAIKRGDERRMQKRLAQQLMTEAGLGDHDVGCGKAELVALQAALGPDYQVKVWSKDLYNAIFFEGPKANKRLCLYLSGAHYDVIRSMPAFYDSSYYCNDCDKPYHNANEHRCGATCVGCGKEGKCEEGVVVNCKDCNRRFANQGCFDTHKLIRQTTLPDGSVTNTSTCTRKKRCAKCFATHFVRTKHLCGFFYCSRCKQQVKKEGHLCYMQPIERKKKRKQKDKDDSDDDNEDTVEVKTKVFVMGWIFFDFETKQEKVKTENEHGSVFEHEVNMCVVQKVCPGCLEMDFGDDSCTNCGQKIFSGAETLEDFCEWLFSPENNGCVAFAHNAKGFDSQFILHYLHSQALKPEVIANGLKIMSLTVGGLRIIDSFSFLPMALAAFPKAFGLSELRKGYFPHFFNKDENWDYVGPLPDVKHYSPDSMKPPQRVAFLKWYEQNKDNNFIFKEELESYCISDVDILRRACLKFRTNFMDVTMVDPFDSSCTIASACMKVFRTRFLPHNSIGLIPHGGYRVKDRHSAIAVKWLMWKGQQEGIRIQHAMNGGEQRVARYKVDGLYEKRVFEFNGCLFHGCPRCFPDRERILPIVHTTAEDLYTLTMDRKEWVEQSGYTVEEMWECQLGREMAVTPGMEEYFASVDIPEPLNPRDCFFGGRTNATKLYHKCSPEERIDYVDVCSLYPWVCKYGLFPVGHPDVIVDDFKTISITVHPYCGPIKCTVLPPRGLLHPVLPARVGGKLFFPLCRTCADKRQKEPCEHTDEERTLSGTWISLELYKALDMGYKIVKVDEVWHYPQTKQYDGKNEHSSLFAGYINTFLKLKTEASGWPSWVQTEDDKETFILNFEKQEGITLDPSNITKNQAFRSLAKLMLNSDAYQPPTGSFLGELTNELEEYDTIPGESYITEFASSGPKSYGYEVFTPSTGRRTFSVKLKGFTQNHKIAEALNFITIRSMVRSYVRFGQKEKTTVKMQTLARTQDRGIETKWVTKTFNYTYEKRTVQDDYTTFPYRY